MLDTDFSKEIEKNQDLNYVRVGENNLDILLSRSELNNSKFVDQEKLKILLKDCKWVGTALEFLWMAKKSESAIKPKGSETAILGMTAFGVRYSFGEAIGASGWEKLYGKYGVDSSGSQTELFMEKLASDDDIKSIVFLVPDKLFSYHGDNPDSPSQEITNKEFQYILDHPEVAKKVFLVFGAYDSVRNDILLKTGAVDEYGIISDGEKNFQMEKELKNQFDSVVKEMSGEDKGLVKFGDEKEMFDYIDSIPEYTFNMDLLLTLREKRGSIPAMFNWFLPLNNKGYENISFPYGVRNTKGYKDWGIGPDILSLADGWKEKDYDVAYFSNPESRKILSEWNRQGVLEENYLKIARRGIDGHLVRLLTHENAPACSDFAIAVMKYLPQIDDQELRSVYISQITDGNEQAQFWTFAPYIYEALRQSRLEKGQELKDEEDFLRVLCWLKSRKRTDTSNADYPALKEFKYHIYDLYLPRNGEHQIHKIAESVGKYIASYLGKTKVSEKLVFAESGVRKSEKAN